MPLGLGQPLDCRLQLLGFRGLGKTIIDTCLDTSLSVLLRSGAAQGDDRKAPAGASLPLANTGAKRESLVSGYGCKEEIEGPAFQSAQRLRAVDGHRRLVAPFVQQVTQHHPSDDVLFRQQDTEGRFAAGASIRIIANGVAMLRHRLGCRGEDAPQQLRRPQGLGHKSGNAQIQAALAASGTADSRVEELPGLNHLFQPCTTGAVNEYNAIETTLDESVLQKITSWVQAH